MYRARAGDIIYIPRKFAHAGRGTAGNATAAPEPPPPTPSGYTLFSRMAFLLLPSLLLQSLQLAAASRQQLLDGGGASQAAALHCRLDGAAATYRIEPWGENSLRVRVGADPAVELPQQALLPQPSKPASRVVTNGPDCSVTNGNLKASMVGGKIHFIEASTGELLLAETSHSVCSGGTACHSKMPGVAASVPPAGSIAFASSTSERLYGLGEHRTGKLDNHGLSLDFMDAGVYDHHQAGDIIMPFYLSEVPGKTTARYGFMWNMASFGSFNSTDTEVRWSSASTPVLDFWVTTAGERSPNPFKAILGQFADATGHPPPMPDFATGFWQCKNRYRSQEELLATAREYKKRGLPISTIVIDYLHWDHFGDFSLNKKCWPDPAAMMKELDDLDIRAMISIWPFVQSGDVYGHDYNATGKSLNFDAMHAGNMLVQDAATGEQAPVFRAPFWVRLLK
jgi:alpha-glucosidase (family GH31 glycosyl hydrolase)